MRLLIIEDERPIAEVMMLNLKRIGYQCDYAMDGEQGCEMRVRSHTEHGDVQSWILTLLYNEFTLVLCGSFSQRAGAHRMLYLGVVLDPWIEKRS